MRSSLRAVLPALVLATAGSSAAAPLVDSSTGVKFEETRTAGGITFKCIGAGVRKKLVVKVYAVTFCLEASAADAAVRDYVAKAHAGKTGEDLQDELEDDGKFFEALSGAKADKLVVMRLVHDISKEKMGEAFRDSLSDVLPAAKVEALVAAVPGDAKDGQTVLLYSKGSALTIDVAGTPKTIDDAEIARKLWRVWLGPDTVSPSLKDSIAARAAGR